MKAYLRKFLKITLRSVGVLVLFVLVYWATAYILSAIPVNSGFKQCEKDAVEIYILTNGVHTDLVLPLKNEIKDWTAVVNPADTKSGAARARFVAFGWGDKGFYLNTPTWGDLKFSTAFNAMFYLSTTAMHVTFYENMNESKSCKKIRITKASYNKLIKYINKSFATDSAYRYKLIKGSSYGRNDAFYDANGTYSLFLTCNSWANNGLKEANLKACYWTAFDTPIFSKYEE
jgi:uncharacterized protein (TIGR02117 family)